MAEQEETNAADALIGGAKNKKTAAGGGKGVIWLVAMIVTIAICAVGGIYAGQVLKSAQAADPETQADAAPVGDGAALPNASGTYQYYDIESITVNLDEPRLSRHVRAAITLAFDAKQESEVKSQVDKRMRELKNWLTVYLAGRTLDEVRGAQSLNRIRREICEAFNEQIWPQQTPRIHHVLFKEFAVQ